MASTLESRYRIKASTVCLVDDDTDESTRHPIVFALVAYLDHALSQVQVGEHEKDGRDVVGELDAMQREWTSPPGAATRSATQGFSQER